MHRKAKLAAKVRSVFCNAPKTAKPLLDLRRAGAGPAGNSHPYFIYRAVRNAHAGQLLLVHVHVSSFGSSSRRGLKPADSMQS